MGWLVPPRKPRHFYGMAAFHRKPSRRWRPKPDRPDRPRPGDRIVVNGTGDAEVDGREFLVTDTGPGHVAVRPSET